MRTATKQMLSEVALIELPIRWEQLPPYESGVYPSLISVSVAVGSVLHDVSAVYEALLVNLPEDDVVATGGAQHVVVEDAFKVFWFDAQPGCCVVGQPLPQGTLCGVTS